MGKIMSTSDTVITKTDCSGEVARLLDLRFSVAAMVDGVGETGSYERRRVQMMAQHIRRELEEIAKSLPQTVGTN